MKMHWFAGRERRRERRGSKEGHNNNIKLNRRKNLLPRFVPLQPHRPKSNVT